MGEALKPYSHTATSAKVLDLLERDDLASRKVLDVGAGEGYFSSLLADRIRTRCKVDPGEVLTACDLYPETFRVEGIRCDPIDANGVLPYPDSSFDCICCIEVIEHLEDQFRLLREFRRILRPGGRAIVTTPNLLNINSRIRYLCDGFWLLFGPLPLRSHQPVHTLGHIHPIGFYYLAYLFYRAGFARTEVHADRWKRSAAGWLLPAYLPMKLGERFLRSRFKRKEPDLFRENEHLLASINSLDMLLSRTVILEGFTAAE